MDIEERILMILRAAEGPVQPDLISSLIAKEKKNELSEAILRLAMNEKVSISADGIVLHAELPEEAPVPEDCLPGTKELGFEGPEAGIPEAEASDDEASSHIVEDDIVWPWSEEECSEANSGLPEWPWEEFQSNVAAGSQDDPEEKPKKPSFFFDPPESLPIKKNSATKARSAGMSTLADLISKIDQPAATGLSDHVRTILLNGLAMASSKASTQLNAEQVAALQSVSGSSKYIIEPLGRIVEAPLLEAKSILNELLDSSQVLEDVRISDILDNEPILKRLNQHGVLTIADFERKSDEELLNIRGFGEVKLNAVKSAIESWRGRPFTPAKPEPTLSFEDFKALYSVEQVRAVEEALHLLDPGGWLLHGESFVITMLPYTMGGDGASASAIVEAFWENIATEQGAIELLAALAQNAEIEEKLLSGALLIPRSAGWDGIARSLASCFNWDYDSETGRLSPHLYTLEEWLGSLEDRKAAILRARFLGKTLAEVGDEFDLTRERVRQITHRELSRRPILKEDEHAYLVDAYTMTEDEFCSITMLAPVAFGYLLEISETRKADRRQLVDAAEDPVLPGDIRQAIRSGSLEGFALLDGEQVPLTRYDLTMNLIEKNASDTAMSADVLYRLFMDLIDEIGVEPQSPVRPASHRAYLAWLIRQDGILYAPVPRSFDPQERCVRLYSYDKDFSILEKCLDEFPYRYVACSAALLLESEAFSEACAQLDIRNAYELHQLLRRYCSGYPGLELGKMPMLTLGPASHVEQLLLLVDELGPISGHELAEEYARRYGMDAFTIEMNYLKEIKAYQVEGVYTFGGEMLPTDQMVELRRLLDKDVCVLEDVREAYVKAFPSQRKSDVSFPVLLHLGYEIRRGLAFRRGANAREVFRSLLDGVEAFDRGSASFPEEYFKDSDFMAELNIRIRSHKLVETDRDCFESLASLVARTGASGLDSNILRSFTDAFIQFLDIDVPQTMFSALSSGFCHPLIDIAEQIGLDLPFLEGIASIGFVGGRLKRTSLEHTPIFARSFGAYNIPDFIVHVMSSNDVSTAEELKPILAQRYGIEITYAKLRQCIARIDD